MAESRDWTDEENGILVSAYCDMLRSELQDERFVKAQVKRQLQEIMGRSPGAIEYKFMNVSAVLREMNFPFVTGYKPYPNIQASLRDTVRDEILRRPELADIAFDKLTRAMPDVSGSAAWIEGEAPTVDLDVFSARPGKRVGRWDFVELEAMNRALGAAGERAVLERERHMLTRMGEHNLAARVEHVSQTVGDGLGFDIWSFEPNGADKLIEVKTTTQGVHWPMVITRNEVDVSVAEAEAYHLYRLHDFSPKSVRFYSLRGDLRATCDLRPETYRALPSGSGAKGQLPSTV